MTTEERGFLGAIIAEPEDDALRLIYADWLEQNAGVEDCPRNCWPLYGVRVYSQDGRRNSTGPCKRCDCDNGRVPDGRAARGEFIRVQVELANREHTRLAGDGASIWHEETKRLRRRERELLVGPDGQCCRCAWHAPLEHYHGDGPKGAWEYRRGFVEAIACSAEDFLRHGDAIRLAAPLRRVRLTTWPVIQFNNLQHETYPAGKNCRFRLADGRTHSEGDDWLYARLRDLDPGSPRYAAEVIPMFKRRWPGIAFELPPAPGGRGG